MQMLAHFSLLMGYEFKMDVSMRRSGWVAVRGCAETEQDPIRSNKNKLEISLEQNKPSHVAC